MAIILRQNKGSELTFAEVDGNFQSLFYSGSLDGTLLNFYYPSSSLSQSFDLSVIPGFGGVTIQDDGTTVINAATGINFTGSGVTVSANGDIATITIDGGGGGGGSSDLTQELTSNQNVGGITSGEIFNAGSSIEALLRTMLITYIEPTVSNLNIQIGGTQISYSVRDVNSSLTCDSVTFSAGVDSPNGDFPENSTLAVTNNDVNFTEVGPVNVQASNTISFSTKTINRATTNGVVVFKVDTESRNTADTQTTTRSISFQWRNYLAASSTVIASGVNLQSVLDNDVVASQLDTNIAWNPTCTSANNDGTKFTYIIYRASYGALNSVIQDGATPVLGAFTELTQQSATNNQGATLTWRIYKSNAAGAFASGTVLTIS
tara:strand:- start:1292 stop:2419 length:1128 start_codon:yes stop_codon:yes gene_type:complete